MATMVLMEWKGVTPEQYTQVMTLLGLDTRPPAGGMFHVAGFSDGALHVTDIWDSAEHFQTFQGDRLTSAVRQAGITTQPSVQVVPAYNMFVPGLDLLRTAGASSLPANV